MPISVVDPISPAIERTKKICFQPFDLSKWLTLGFCVFLATCDQQASQGNFNFSTGGGGGGGPGGGGGIDDIQRWIENNAAFTAAIIAGALIVMAVIAAIVAWLGARGKFMFIDGVVHNRGEVVRPWKQYAHLADSYFKLRFTLILLSIAVVIVPLGAWAALAWDEIKQGDVRGSTLAVAATLVVLMVFSVLALALFNWVLMTFVQPIMYLLDVRVGEGLSIFRHEVLRGNLGAIVLFFLMQLALGIGAGVIIVLGTCITCCIAALPYVSSVVFLPIFVFFKCYDLYFLQQFNPALRFFDAAGVCSVCGYDLRGSEGRSECPGCGAPIPESAPPPDHPPTSPA